MNRKFSLAFDFIFNFKNAEIVEGKYEIDGSKIYGLTQEYYTQPADRLVWEAHRRYIDLQYIVRGIENMGYAHINDMQAISDYVDIDDYVLFKGNGNYLNVKEGFFTIFFPHDCHKVRVQTEIGSSRINKIVVKICI